MMTSPTVDDLLEGFIAALQNEIMPHVGSPKAYTMCQMLQSLIQEVRQVVPVYDTYVAEEHNGMTKVLRETAAALGSVNGEEADRIRERAATLGARIVGRGDPIPDSFRNSLPEGTEIVIEPDVEAEVVNFTLETTKNIDLILVPYQIDLTASARARLEPVFEEFG